MTRSLLDTSVLIASAVDARATLPESAAISVITLGELRAGVIRARGHAARAARQAHLTAVTNVDASKIEAFDARGAVLDARAVKVHHAGGDETAGLRAFQADQGDWFVRRTSFEGLWRDGSRFVYGAVHAGGMGVERPRFGHFCLVIADPATGADAVAVFPADSAEHYTTLAGDVDRDRARREAAAWRDRGHCATIERAADVPGAPDSDWPRLICNAQRYLEAIVAPGPPLGSVDAVRVRESYLDRLADLTVAGSDDPLEAATEQRELNAIETLRRWRSDHAIAIEPVG